MIVAETAVLPVGVVRVFRNPTSPGGALGGLGSAAQIHSELVREGVIGAGEATRTAVPQGLTPYLPSTAAIGHCESLSEGDWKSAGIFTAFRGFVGPGSAGPQSAEVGRPQGRPSLPTWAELCPQSSPNSKYNLRILILHLGDVPVGDKRGCLMIFGWAFCICDPVQIRCLVLLFVAKLSPTFHCLSFAHCSRLSNHNSMSEIPPDGLDGQLPLAARRGGATAKASRSNTLQAQLTSSMPTRGRGLSSGSSRQPTTAFSGRGRGARMGSMYHLDDTGGLNTQPQSLNQTESKSSSPLVAESSIPSSPTLDPPNSDVPAAPVVQDRRKITARDHLHPHWYIRCIMYLVAFLHTRHRVTFRAAGVILICVGLIFSLLFGDLVGALAMPRTLKTVFARFEMKDRFVVNPICFQCHVIFESDIQPPTFCPKCDEDVFGAPERDDENDWENTDSDPGETPSSPTSSKRKRKPNMVSPIQLLSSGLQDFFNRPGMVDAVEAWRKRPSADGELKSMQDGEVWKTLKDAQGRSFFFGAHSEEEIRLGVSFSLDWFNRSKSSFAPSTSSGAMSFCVQNLSTSLR
ncbi:hypothetical protein B0H10DRAFT_1292762 [Mycena sp. CBHHK59/15]|nr:hypothetical protein B0H10DRAFT_1292762 [Mycena sp. CBHHK59/15]